LGELVGIHEWRLVHETVLSEQSKEVFVLPQRAIVQKFVKNCVPVPTLPKRDKRVEASSGFSQDECVCTVFE
jgi:hypothetical protein